VEFFLLPEEAMFIIHLRKLKGS